MSLFYYYQKVFILMNIWMIGKNLRKHYLKKKSFSQLNIEDITDAGYEHTKSVCKDFKKNIKICMFKGIHYC